MAMDIGTHLREARERRNLTIRQVADATKLSPATLQHIERNAFDRLPGGIFARGFLRAYAAAVGVDPEEVVSEYRGQTAGAVEVPAKAHEPEVETGRGHLVATAIAVLVTLLVYGVLRESERPVTGPPDVVQTPVESLAAKEAVPDALPAAERREPGLRLEIAPTAACWISAVADGQRVFHRLAQNGDLVTITAERELVLRVGEPAAFEYTLNGTRGRPLGAAGIPVTLEITLDNYQTFLAGSAAGA